MSLQEAASQGGRGATKFCPATFRRLRIGWQKEFHEKKLLNRSARPVGSLQVTCSRLGISLRRRDLLSSKGPGRPRLVSSPSAPSIVGQMQAGRPRF